MPRFRYVGNRILTWLTRIASGYWTIGDPQNGYTAISLHALKTAGIEEMYEYYGYCNDILVRLNVADMRVVDVPSPTIYGDEESHIEYGEYIPRVSTMLAGNFFRRLRAKYLDGYPHPIALLYASAALLALAGVGAGVATGDLTTLAGGFLLSVLVFVAAMAWDRTRERPLDGRVSPDADADPGTTPQPEPIPTD
jgi:hypothetical protein